MNVDDPRPNHASQPKQNNIIALTVFLVFKPLPAIHLAVDPHARALACAPPLNPLAVVDVSGRKLANIELLLHTTVLTNHNRAAAVHLVVLEAARVHRLSGLASDCR